MPSLNQKICSVEGCERVHFANGYCKAHNQRVYRYGSSFSGKPLKHQFYHGLRLHPLYDTWEAMRQRCTNPNVINYKSYGGRGIKVCERWDDFALFLQDMGERPEGMSLDRYPNNDGDYEPGNVRWATWTQQNRNQRSNKLSMEEVHIIRVDYYGGKLLQKELAEKYGVTQAHISMIVNNKKWR